MTDRPCLQSEVSSAWQISLKQSRGRWSELESRCGGGASSSLSQIEKEEYCLRSPAHRPFSFKPAKKVVVSTTFLLYLKHATIN